MKRLMLIVFTSVLLASCDVNNGDDVTPQEQQNLYFPNTIIEDVYNEFNHYYAGYYLDDSNRITICMTNDAPQSLINLVNDANLNTQLVTYSYAELNSIREILSSKVNDYGIESIGINVKDNRIEITLNEDDEVNDDLKEYIKEGIIKIDINNSKLEIVPTT